jgi:hypothetical protein
MQEVGVGFHTDASVAGVETGDHHSVRRIGTGRGSVVLSWNGQATSASPTFNCIVPDEVGGGDLPRRSRAKAGATGCVGGISRVLNRSSGHFAVSIFVSGTRFLSVAGSPVAVSTIQNSE